MLAAFFEVILTAIRWLGATAFTGATGAAIGTAFMSGVLVLVARMGVSLVTFGIIYAATSQIMAYGLAGIVGDQVAGLMAITGLATGINILLSTLQAIIAIRVLKIGFQKGVVG